MYRVVENNYRQNRMNMRSKDSTQTPWNWNPSRQKTNRIAWEWIIQRHIGREKEKKKKEKRWGSSVSRFTNLIFGKKVRQKFEIHSSFRANYSEWWSINTFNAVSKKKKKRKKDEKKCNEIQNGRAYWWQYLLNMYAKKKSTNNFSFFGKIVQPPWSVKILMNENKWNFYLSLLKDIN